MSESNQFAGLVFKTSSRSAGGNCVEVAIRDNEHFVRDSKNRKGPILKFSADEWNAFIAGIRAGEFE